MRPVPAMLLLAFLIAVPYVAMIILAISFVSGVLYLLSTPTAPKRNHWERELR